MSTATEDISEPKAEPVRPKLAAAKEPSTDKYAAARHAKKLQRRRAHRVTLRRSHTNG